MTVLMSDTVAYWDRGLSAVPWVTGASTLMDGHDIVSLCDECGIALPLPRVLDVGCGSGRLAQHATGYVGCDIAPSAVEFCLRRGFEAHEIDSPDGLEDLVQAASPFELVTALSVFTHIDREERRAYLRVFRQAAGRLLVDIIPGDGSGDVAMWTAVESEFRADLQAAGYDIWHVADRISPTGLTHRYFYALLAVASGGGL
jgi:SAM-dependent methyltransferase